MSKEQLLDIRSKHTDRASSSQVKKDEESSMKPKVSYSINDDEDVPDMDNEQSLS